MDQAPDLLRHIHACNTAILPGNRAPFLFADQQVGWVLPVKMRDTIAWQESPAGTPRFGVNTQNELDQLIDQLNARGELRLRHENFDIRSHHETPALAHVDRDAIPLLGCLAVGVHMNGLVRKGSEWLLWVARRAAHKPLDPGKLDHLAAGGVPAGLDPFTAMRKEAGEEAGIADDLAAQAVLSGRIDYTMQRDEGLRRDRLYCFDLELPEDFMPRAVDGEVESFELWPLRDVLEDVRHGDGFKFNVKLVLIDLCLRKGLIDPASAEGQALRAALPAL